MNDYNIKVEEIKKIVTMLSDDYSNDLKTSLQTKSDEEIEVMISEYYDKLLQCYRMVNGLSSYIEQIIFNDVLS